MLYAGEDVKFIARRIMICASEDVGNADPMALTVAVAAAQAVERIGMPSSVVISFFYLLHDFKQAWSAGYPITF